MKKFDPLKNVQTSKVFFELLNNVKTSTEIAEKFKVSPQSVYEHIKRMIAIRIVRPGKRHGKYQEYEVDLELFCDLFLKRSVRSLGTYLELKERLTINKAFISLVQTYLREIGKLPLNITLHQSVKAFEEALLRVYPVLKLRSSLNSQEEIALLQTMNEWYEHEKDSFTPIQASLIRAFDDMNLTTEKYFSYE